ncbi:MAG TPA: SpaA isopeptide-forming pilin-related protein [Gemmiger qucibialis]|nr:SpaA isopeptide-forming pilin-related protein [Gemmiger qucibialis]
MAMALPVYAEVDLLPDAPDEVELLEDEQGTASGEDTVPPEQNAATPEPEQSAEPEQPAPTETPEPTAEPTPTPEPAATATATPVPTVTPTATPEPTEQPQKMYAAKSVDNVQAVSEQRGVPETYTLYFAVPDGWSECTVVKIYAADGGNPSSDHKYFLDMQEVDETKDRRKIYSVVLKHEDNYHNGGLNGLEFRGYKSKGEAFENGKPADTAYKVVIAEVDQNLGSKWMSFNSGDTNNYIGGNYYDGKSGKWSTYTVGHKHFAGQKMAFENKTSKTLTNVKAWFYESNGDGVLEQVGDPILLNSDGLGSGIASGSTATFAIPKVLCSFVRFTAGDSDTEISEYYNFYNEEVTGEKQKRFQYSEGQCYCYMYNGIEDATWGRPGAIRIYYDATFSKMALNGDTDDFSIPKANNNNKETIYYRIKGDGVESESGTLVKDGTNENLYYIDIPQGYRSIIFSGDAINGDEETKGNGVSTAWLPIPTDDKNCFYADTNDDAVYKGTTRGGYWAPKGTLRDAETWKNPDTKVVDIAAAEFTEKPNTKYVTSTLYDYYTDYELNGNNRDSYDNDNAVNQRHWVPFRQFDQAISDYYQSYVDKNTGKPIIYPIYTGHFQPSDWDKRFADIASTLNLYGWSSYNIFIAANNSNFDIGDTKEKKNSYAFQGIVADKRDSDGDIVMNGTTLKEPHFNEKFLTGQNSKNAKLGEVYHNVEFPFTQEEVFIEPAQTPNGPQKGEGVKYWWFDSKETSLYLRKDTNSDQLYLGNDSPGVTTAGYKSEASHNVDSASSPDNVSTPYGFFPFNETTTSKSAVRYNYGYGAKLEIPFTLTSTGTVKDDYNNEIPIRFYFSGDDDVWVFIDNQLVLDIGGAHARVSGVLEFDQRDNKKNTVTSYVSRVKNSKTDNYGAEDCDENKHETETSITYLGTTETYYKNASVSIPNLSTGKHTLTMYYMERGMWESNMAVAFNFPDNNELQVQKEVDLTNVTDDDFKNCFKDQKIFNFTIQNQATHYGEKEAAGSDTSGTKEVNLTADCDEIKPATNSTEGEYIFKLDTNPEQGSGPEGEKVLHWYARYTDTEPVSAARKKRYGILTLKNPIDIKDERFLTFQVYVDPKDHGGDLSLNNLYLELLDENNVQKGSLGTTGINGATYGSVELVTGKWVTVKLDLNKMKKQDNFNNYVKTIRVGDNYSRHIYFRNFTFIPKAVPSTMTGFTTDQKEIPDYGSAKSGNLENAINAQYTSTEDSDTQLVDEDGRFVLEDGETVTFSDQFRRGSYISLKEDLNQNLYDTKWTVYENGWEVNSMSGGNTVQTVKVADTSKSLVSQSSPAAGPDDGRTEVYVDKDGVRNEGYKESKKPDTGTNTIVFRSYKDPDETSSTLTKLKVKYVNTVKTGGLKIQKKAAEGETLTGTYTFKVTFNDVGGEGLEEKPIERTVTIDMGKGESTGTITGIPVGTRYTIEEVKTDDSRLQSVTVPKGQSAHVIDNTMVEGVIVASNDPNNPEVTAIFTNTKRKLINIEFDKLWKDANGTVLGTTNQPNEIYIQLQRKNSAADAKWEVVDYPTSGSKYVTVRHTDNGWLYPFNNLDQYPVGGSADNNYIYRIVEGTVENGEFKQAAEDGTITIDGKTYVVTAEATAKSEKDSETGATTTPATATDGTITGGSGKIVLTNTLQNPKFVLDIIKKDAEKGENGKEVPLSDVEFKLEKLVETTEGKTQVDTTYTGTTDDNGKIISNPFKDLEPGTYRLTETKAHPGYNLLAQPIKIKFTQEGKCSIDGVEVKKDDKTFILGTNNTYTMTLTVLNRKTPELPHTGADAPSLWLLIGMPLAVAGLLIFTFRYNRKGGRRH